MKIKDKIRNYIPLYTSSGKHYFLTTCLYIIKNKLGFYNKYKKVNWQKVNRLVIICTGNICRSPYAEYKARQLGLTAISAGIRADGVSRANESAMKQSAYRNVDISPHRSNTLDQINYSESDLIVCMEPTHLQHIENNIQISKTKCQFTLLGLWNNNKSPVINDPYGKDELVFQNCFAQIDAGLISIYTKLSNN